jgi:hypothetical protein
MYMKISDLHRIPVGIHTDIVERTPRNSTISGKIRELYDRQSIPKAGFDRHRNHGLSWIIGAIPRGFRDIFELC